MSGPRAGRRFDPVRLSIYQHLLSACAEEMGSALGRSASSANIKERRDYSCAVFDHAGRMVAQAAHIPVHLGSMPMSVQAALARGPLDRGDAVLVNDPYEGGTHLPDITLVLPVFLPGERRARFYVANRAHHADVGGMSPGSLPLAREMVQEGVRIPPVKIIERGVPTTLWARRERSLEPFADTTAPVVGPITVAADRGRIDATVEAYDVPPITPPAPWQDARWTPEIVRWRLLHDGRELTPWTDATDFSSHLPPGEFSSVYAPGTEQNAPGRPGRYVFWLARGLRAEPGTYELQVEAEDTRGNVGSASSTFEVAQILRTRNTASR